MKHYSNKHFSFLIFACLLAFFLKFAGCSSSQKVQDLPSTTNVDEEIQRLSSEVQAAIANQVDVLAPTSYERANEALLSAKSRHASGGDREDTLEDIATGKAYIMTANESANLARDHMQGVVDARQAAVVARAPELFADDFQRADRHLKELTVKIEKKYLYDISRNRKNLQAEYLDVELKAIQHVYLHSPRTAITQAIEAGAKKLAPESLAIAKKKVNDTDAFIIANRRQLDAIQQRSDDAMAAANHLLKITQSSKSNRNMTSEEIALQFEQKQSQLKNERATSQTLAKEATALKADQDFNRLFEQALDEFSSKEADVYRKGNQLVIRLRALQFPTNSATLRKSNEPLLDKVGKVVKDFENPMVVVEGHTDSVGGKELNTNLSKERADAVSSYLVSNNVISDDRISSMGLAYDRPLATNKTSKGKAQNRRVDVIIIPQPLNAAVPNLSQ